jgi:hypothetical protein
MLDRLVKTYPAKNIFIKIISVSSLLGVVHYIWLSSASSAIDSAIYSFKFIAFLFGGYSLIQVLGRRIELNQRRKELVSANGNSEKIREVQEQLDNIKRDKKTGELFMLLAFFIVLTLYLLGKA